VAGRPVEQRERERREHQGREHTHAHHGEDAGAGPHPGDVAEPGQRVRRHQPEAHADHDGGHHRHGGLEQDHPAQVGQAEARRAQQRERPPPLDDAGEHADGEAAGGDDQDEVPPQPDQHAHVRHVAGVGVDPVLPGVDQGVGHEPRGEGPYPVLGRQVRVAARRHEDADDRQADALRLGPLVDDRVAVRAAAQVRQPSERGARARDLAEPARVEPDHDGARLGEQRRHLVRLGAAGHDLHHARREPAVAGRIQRRSGRVDQAGRVGHHERRQHDAADRPERGPGIGGDAAGGDQPR
jgi:hypothetical protein